MGSWTVIRFKSYQVRGLGVGQPTGWLIYFFSIEIDNAKREKKESFIYTIVTVMVC